MTRRRASTWREAARKARRAETTYARQLRKVAYHVGEIIDKVPTGSVMESWPELEQALAHYAAAIDPWARAVTRRMQVDTDRHELSAWIDLSKQMGLGLRREIESAPTGHVLQALLHEQVNLIKSLPLEAAERVHEMTLSGITEGLRPAQIAARIRETGGITVSRANLIARTEVSRTASTLMQARAEHVGSPGYIWRPVMDSDTRPSHRKLAGTMQRWDSPPLCDPPNYRAHPGCIWNCFPGSTKVALTNGCHHLWRHRYEGRLVCIQHEAGLLELTPNHPVLTLRGWVAAENIDARDYLVQCSQDRGFALDDDEHQGQPTFDEVFAALEVCLDREAHVGFLFDFHGYVPNDDVDAISAEHLLPGYGVSPLFQGFADLALSRAKSMVVLPIFRSGAELGITRVSGSRRDLGPVLVRHGPHSSDVGLRACAALDAVSEEDARDNETGAAESLTDGKLALPADVGRHDSAFVKVLASVLSRRNAARDFDAACPETLADYVRMIADLGSSVLDSSAGRYKALRVLDKSDRDFCGHVFTMETADGWFSVTGASVIVKNCRCYAEVVLP